MRVSGELRKRIWAQNERLGFPIWLPLLLGVVLFLAGHLLAATPHHARPRISHPVHKVSYYRLTSV